MIFPEHCKHVGHASTKPCDDKVYFLSRWLLRDTPGGHEVLEVTLDPTEKGMMREVLSSRVLAQENEVYHYPEKVNLHNRTRLVELALDTGYRCTIFTGHDEHQTFVLDPDLSGFLKIHVYDVSPPRPSLSSCIRELEDVGLFGDLSVQFCHHIRDITEVHADVYPCRAAGFERTLDADAMQGGEQVAGCLTCIPVLYRMLWHGFPSRQHLPPRMRPGGALHCPLLPGRTGRYQFVEREERCRGSLGCQSGENL